MRWRDVEDQCGVRSIDCEEVRRGRRHGVLVKLGRTGLKVETSFEEL